MTRLPIALAIAGVLAMAGPAAGQVRVLTGSANPQALSITERALHLKDTLRLTEQQESELETIRREEIAREQAFAQRRIQIGSDLRAGRIDQKAALDSFNHAAETSREQARAARERAQGILTESQLEQLQEGSTRVRALGSLGALRDLESLRNLEGLRGLESLRDLEGLRGLESLRSLEGLRGLESLRNLRVLPNDFKIYDFDLNIDLSQFPRFEYFDGRDLDTSDLPHVEIDGLSVPVFPRVDVDFPRLNFTRPKVTPDSLLPRNNSTRNFHF